eukprot:jgi/Chrzof1/1993/Cz10g29010.t1
MSFFVPTRFVWRFGGRQVRDAAIVEAITIGILIRRLELAWLEQVHLCGSFTRWVETIPMAPVEGTPGVFAVVVHLPPGYHQYKFIVDGKWMHDETAPYMPDPLGNVNNWLFVRKIEPPAGQHPAGMPPEQQAALMQQAQQAQQQQQPPQQLQQQQQPQPTTPIAIPSPSQQQQQQQQQQQPQQQRPQQPLAPQQQQQQQQQPPPLQQPPSSSTAPSQLPAALQPPAQQEMPSSTTPVSSDDVDMTNAEVVAPIIIHNSKEPDLTRKKVSDFLHGHSAYELIPESGKVVLLDVDLPVRQAFHALHEQGIASAPLWDSAEGTLIGVISASDFIHILRRLRVAVSSGSNPMSEQEMDAHTIRGLREEASLDGREPKQLVYVKPDDNLAKVVRTLSDHKCSMAPILSCDPGGLSVPTVLHIATLSGVLACLMRHFRASLASLPLLSQPLGHLPLGTWAPDSSGGLTQSHADLANGREHGKQVRPLHTVHPSTPLTTALGMLLETGVSALPVVNEQQSLLDIYARADITRLCKGNAYNRLQWEDVTVGQALSLLQAGPTAWSQGSSSGQHSNGPFMPGQDMASAAGVMAGMGDSQVRSGAAGGPKLQRVAMVTRDDPLRVVVERLAGPGIRRLIVVDRASGRVEGVVSLSDVAAYLFL